MRRPCMHLDPRLPPCTLGRKELPVQTVGPPAPSAGRERLLQTARMTRHRILHPPPSEVVSGSPCTLLKNLRQSRSLRKGHTSPFAPSADRLSHPLLRVSSLWRLPSKTTAGGHRIVASLLITFLRPSTSVPSVLSILSMVFFRLLRYPSSLIVHVSHPYLFIHVARPLVDFLAFRYATRFHITHFRGSSQYTRSVSSSLLPLRGHYQYHLISTRGARTVLWCVK